MKFTLACLAMLVLPQSVSGMAHAGVKVKLIGMVQSSGPGASGAKALNLWAGWAGDNGYSITHDLQTWDGSSSTIAADIKALIDAVPSDTQGILIPPYGSGDTKTFIEALPAGTTMPIMIWGGAADSLFSSTCTGKHCFGTFTVGSQYMALGLKAILAKSSKPLTVGLIQNNNAFSASVATGAEAYISSTEGLTLGKKVVLETKGSLSSADLTAVKEVIDMKPSIIAIAGHSGDVEPTIAEVMKSYVPGAILATNSIGATATTNFKNLDVPDAAHCLLMPTQWGYTKVADEYTNWTSDAFKQAFGTDPSPSYHAASAAAAGIAITQAIVLKATKGLDFVAAMKAVDTPSFYGHIKFNTDGSIDKPMFVQQNQGMKGNPVFTTMFGDLAYPLASCSGWGKPKTCLDVHKMYWNNRCCKAKHGGSDEKEVDTKDMTKWEGKDGKPMAEDKMPADKSGDTKSADTKSGDTKSADTKSGDTTKSGETKDEGAKGTK